MVVRGFHSMSTQTPSPAIPPPIPATAGTAPDAAPHAAPDPLHDVHLSRAHRPRGRRAHRHQRHANFRSLVPVLRMPQFFTVGIVVSLATVLAGVSSKLLSVTFLPLVITAVVLATAAWIWYQARRALPAVPPGVSYTIAPEIDQRFRLRLTASERQAHAVLGPGLSDNLFEPRVFQVPLALPKPAWPAFTAYIVVTVALSLLWTFMRIRFVSLLGSVVAGPWDYWAVACATMVPFAWMWPTYLRVTPGRLDVMRYRFLGAGVPAVTTFDLRSVRLLIDLGAGAVLIGEEGNEQRVVLSDYGPRWTEIARALLEAARYQGPLAEPLPDDALVG